MKICRLAPISLNVEPIAQALAANPQLWDQHRMRTESPNSPHREANDIWVRYNAIENFTTIDDFNGPHESSWYPAADLLHVKPFVLDIMRLVEGTQLGGVLITRIPPGKQVYPHIDRGWHARYYEKYAVQIRGNDKQAFRFDDEELVTRTGDFYSFDNSFRHHVVNDSYEDRITMIICIRRH